MQYLQKIFLITLCLAPAPATPLEEEGPRSIDPKLFEVDNSALSTRGNEFIIGFFGNYITNPRRGSATLLVTTDEPGGANFTVNTPNFNISGFPMLLSVFPGSTTAVSLPYNDDSLDIQVHNSFQTDKGVHVFAEENKLISVVGFNDEEFSADAFLALPCHSYDSPNYDYFVFSSAFGSISSFTSRILMVPCEDDIRITVTGSQNLNIGFQFDPTSQFITPGQSSQLRRTFKFQTILLESNQDLTGTIISATGPISVFVGSECGQVPTSVSACDYMVEQVPPHITWGRLFLAVPFGLRQSGDLFKIGSIVDDNTVTITCANRNENVGDSTTVILNRGGLYQFDTRESLPGVDYYRDYCTVQSSSPVSVMQYTKGHSADNLGSRGDPSMVLVTPVEQYFNNHAVVSAIPTDVNSFVHFVSWSIASLFFDNSERSINNFLIDGKPFIPGLNENSEGYVPFLSNDNSVCGYGAFSSLSGQDHIIEYVQPNAGVNAIMYGFANEASYAYPAGFQMESIGLAQITVFDEIVREGIGSILITTNRTGGELNLISRMRANTRDRGNGGAEANDDYIPIINHRLRWSPGQIQPREGPNDSPVIIDIIDDDIPEVAEYFEVVFLTERNAYLFPNSVARITILDDDQPLFVGLPLEYEVHEDSQVLNVVVTTNDPRALMIQGSVLLYTQDIDAISGEDYEGIDITNPILLVFEEIDGVFEAKTTVKIAIYNDSIIEMEETFEIRLMSNPNYPSIPNLIFNSGTATVHLFDGHETEVTVGPVPPQMVQFETNSSTVNEGEVIGVKLISSGLILVQVSVTVISLSDSATTPEDFNGLVINVTFPVGSREQTISVETIKDSIKERTESFKLILQELSDTLIVGNISEHTVHILDTSPDINVTLDRLIYTVSESSNTVEICLLSNNGNENPFEVVLVSQESRSPQLGKAAQGGVDFLDSKQVVSFPSSPMKQKQCTNFTLLPDQISLEYDEEFIISIENITTGRIGDVSEAKVIIMDDDTVIVSLEHSRYTVTEEETTIEVCATSNSGNAESFDVIIAASEITGGFQLATDGSDFSSGTKTLSFPSSLVQQKQCTNFLLIPDDIALEDDEEFDVFIANITKGGQIGEISQAQVVIVDDDELRITIQHPLYSVSETSDTVKICLLSNTGNAQPTDVRFVVQEILNTTLRATDGNDFVSLHQDITFMPSTEKQSLCVNVTLIPDEVPLEFEEYISVVLDLSTSMAVPGDITEAMIEIIDDDVLEVNFVSREISVSENSGEQIICLNISSALSESIILSAVIIGSSSSDTIEFVFEPQQQISCITLTIADDTLVGNTRDIIIVVDMQENILVSSSMVVTVVDDDTDVTVTDPTHFTCTISNPLMTSPFNSSTSFTFKGTCELIALSSCDISHPKYFRIAVDFLTDTLNNGAVGVFTNNFKWISREDGTFFTDYEGLTNIIDEDTLHYVDSGITVQAINSSTKIMVDNGIGVTIQHIYGNAIIISTEGTSSQDFCGICEESELHANQSTIQTFVDNYRVLPRDQSLRSQRQECGKIRNDSVIGDPLFTVPMFTDSNNNENLCFEVHGIPDTDFNIISDRCVNVNAHFVPMKVPANGNIIGAIGVKAENNIGDCKNIKVELNECKVSIDSSNLNSKEKYSTSGISVRQYTDRVRITVPNCEQVKLVMWVICERGEQDMIRFQVARGLNLRPTSHGLLGQFWNIRIEHSLLPTNNSPYSFYNVTVFPQSNSSSRSFSALRYGLTWDNTEEYCSYAGNSQGGASNQFIDPDDSVIEGPYTDYAMRDIFDTNFKYSMWASCTE